MLKNNFNLVYLLAGLYSSIKVLHKCMICINHRTSPRHVSTDWRLQKITQCPSYFELKAFFSYTNQKLSTCRRQNLQVTETNISCIRENYL